MDRFSDLELFVRLVGRGSLAGAAQELGLTGAAVSKRLAALERRLGARLVNRSTRRLSVTPEGERYLAQGRGLLQALDELEPGVRGASAAPAGLLRVNASLGFGRAVVAPALAEFAGLHPAVEVQLHLSDRPLNLVEHGFDVGIRLGELDDSRLVARRLLPNRRVVCASPAYLKRHGAPAAPAELVRHRAIVLRESDEAYGAWTLHQGRRRETVKVRGAMSTNDGAVAMAWARAGLGLLLRSEWDVGDELRRGRLQVVLPKWSAPADVHAVFAASPPVRTRAFVDFLARRLEKVVVAA
jgi:LysR family transcriptional activator of dmlA